MSQQYIKQVRGLSQGSVLFLGTNSVVSEDYNKLNWSQSDSVLSIGGKIKIVDGSQQNGYVLTTDSNGLATWSQSAGGVNFATADLTFTDNRFHDADGYYLHLENLKHFHVSGVSGSTTSVNIDSPNSTDPKVLSFRTNDVERFTIEVDGVNDDILFKSHDNSGLFTTASIKIDRATSRVEISEVYRLPVVDGGNGQVLTSNGSGNLYWSTPGSSPVVTGTFSVDFSFSGGYEDYNTQVIVNDSNITTDSMVLFNFMTSSDHQSIDEFVVENITLNVSDIINSTSFVVNAYASNGTWGIYNLKYRIVN